MKSKLRKKIENEIFDAVNLFQGREEEISEIDLEHFVIDILLFFEEFCKDNNIWQIRPKNINSAHDEPVSLKPVKLV